MDTTPLAPVLLASDQEKIAEVFKRERTRLKQFIARRVSDQGDAEDILQDVFFEFIEASRLSACIEQVGAWLFRVARNRIIDRFRKRREEPLRGQDQSGSGDEEDGFAVIPGSSAGPEADLMRLDLFEALYQALAELQVEQREVFLAHEIDGLTFKQLAATTGLSINTLLARKRYAVLHLRKRLGDIENDWL